MVVDRLWRAEALAEMIAEAGLQPEIARTDENTPLVRTAVDARLVAIAARLDAGRGQDRAPAVAARPAGTAGLDAGRRHARGRPVSARPGPARPRHAFAARIGDDAGRDSPDADRHARVPSGAADQWPTTAIAPGRERGGTSGQRRSVCAMAPHLATRAGGGPVCVGWPRGAKLSVASGSDQREALYIRAGGNRRSGA